MSLKKIAFRRITTLRVIRRMSDEVLESMTKQFDRLYSGTGRPSIPPEHLLRAFLLQVLYSIRSERLLMEQLDYNLVRMKNLEAEPC